MWSVTRKIPVIWSVLFGSRSPLFVSICRYRFGDSGVTLMSPHLSTILSSTDDCGNNHVRIKDPVKVNKKIEELVATGPDGILVITDFDMTLSRYHKDGTHCESCYGAIRSSPLMPNEFRKKAQAIWSKYYPIEIDERLTTEEKIPVMEEWYGESHKNLLSQSLHKEDLKKIVLNSQIKLRDGAEDMLACLSKKQVPVLIFSAGVGDILEFALEKFKCEFSNMTVISNFLDYDAAGLITGFKSPLIHVFNKTSRTLRQCQPEYLEGVRDRKHVILLGDSVGDVEMSEGIEHLQTVLKIGFLNTNVEQRLESFLEVYDIVLIDDQTMNVPNSILERVLGQS